MDVACEICGGDESKCEKESQKKKQDATLGYDAMSRPKVTVAGPNLFNKMEPSHPSRSESECWDICVE